MALEAGLDGVAITDHDECRGFGALKPVPGLILIPGIEIAAHEEDCEVHVLGLDIDWRHGAMTGYSERAAERRLRRAQAVAEKLRAAGYDLELEDVERASAAAVGAGRISRGRGG